MRPHSPCLCGSCSDRTPLETRWRLTDDLPFQITIRKAPRPIENHSLAGATRPYRVRKLASFCPEARINGLAFERQHAEDAFVGAAQRLFANEPLNRCR
jgi:hypothetical protein